jgi:D-3-phosphoglycerate dehydrogenase / 2-oxoglutarate reductase
MNFKVLVSDAVRPEGLQSLLEADDMEVVQQSNLSEDELIEIIGDFDALIVRSATQVNKRVLQAARKLKVIGRAGVGVDNIDVDEATSQGIAVINAPDGNTISTAEHTFSMLCALARRIPQAYMKLKNHKWDRKSFIGVELYGKTLGIIGMGRIGSEVARRAKVFHMKVIAYDPFLKPEKAEKLGIQSGSLTEVIQAGDFLTVHTPLLKETKHMISTEQFKQMKDGVRILNCARGGIIDEDALYEAIKSGKVAGAALDVFEEEPATDHPLLELPEVIATPHLGASTEEAQHNVAVDVSQELAKLLRGQPFKNAVNLPSIPAHIMEKVQPYLHLSEQLGSFIAQLEDSPIRDIHIAYAGDLTDIDVSPLTRNVLKGVLAQHLGKDQVNDVNAPHLAKERGITFHEQKSSESRGFTNLISVEITNRDNTHRLWGTLLNGYGARLVKVDDYTIDVDPEGHILYVRHHDRPGVIGRVGTLLGKEDVNIATMQVGRSNRGGDAIMMLTVDREVPQEVLNILLELDEIKSVTEIDL